jgi:hypothetical protein
MNEFQDANIPQIRTGLWLTRMVEVHGMVKQLLEVLEEDYKTGRGTETAIMIEEVEEIDDHIESFFVDGDEEAQS